MSKSSVRFGSAIGLVALLGISPAAQDHQHSGEALGTVHFTNSCSTTVQDQFGRAMALLHSFEFGPAIEGFTAATKADPSCAMGHWGIAIARWGNPFAAMLRPAAQLQQGLDAITAAEKAGAWTAREREYIAAAKNLYADGATPQLTRLVGYEHAMGALAAKYPDDAEASIFWALSLTASASPTDKTYANQLKAVAILEKLYPQQPNHPGITHYIIHSYDNPALADHALAAAHRYAEIAPSSAHALHMPSHIFTRVGAWDDSIASNLASSASARKSSNLGETLHATDYLTYAYLQSGQDAKALAIVKSLPGIPAEFDPGKVTVGAAGNAGGSFAMAAIPARWALEHRDWKAAAALTTGPRSAFPYTDAMTLFARALGASHTGALDDARASIASLDAISQALMKSGEAYWAEQVAIQHDGAAAFLLLAEGKGDAAVTAMRATAAREDATDKNAVTPGPLAPARELLGDMLLDLKQPKAALVEFQAVMKKEPNRFRAVYGAAKASADSGDQTTARTYYQQLLTICRNGDQPGRAELVEARKALAR